MIKILIYKSEVSIAPNKDKSESHTEHLLTFIWKDSNMYKSLLHIKSYYAFINITLRGVAGQN